MENPTSPTAVEQLQKIASEFYHTFLEDENHDDNSAALAVVEVVTKIAQLPVRSARPVKFCRKGAPRTVYIDRNIKEGGNRIYADYFSPNPVYPEPRAHVSKAFQDVFQSIPPHMQRRDRNGQVL